MAMSAATSGSSADPVALVEHVSSQMVLIIRALETDRITLKQKLGLAADREENARRNLEKLRAAHATKIADLRRHYEPRIRQLEIERDQLRAVWYMKQRAATTKSQQDETPSPPDSKRTRVGDENNTIE